MDVERKYVIHSNLTDGTGNPLVLDFLGSTKHLTLSSLTGAATDNQKFRVSKAGNVKNHGLGDPNGFVTRDPSGSVPLFVRCKPQDTTATGKDTQIWSFHHVGKYTFVMLTEVLVGDDIVVDRFYLTVSTANTGVAPYTLIVKQLHPDQIDPNMLWFFEDVT
jgi:hypothetical protein